MNILIYFVLAPISLFFGIFVFLYLLFFIDTLRGHDLPTSKIALKVIYKIISEEQGKSKRFYDLGCGRGTVCLAIKKEFSDFSVYAVDKNGLRLFFAKLKALFFRKKIVFINTDIMKLNLKDADIVYTYLWYDVMPGLGKKLQQELKKGAMVIANTSKFPVDWKPTKTYIVHNQLPGFEKMFVYII